MNEKEVEHLVNGILLGAVIAMVLAIPALILIIRNFDKIFDWLFNKGRRPNA
jgi:hypothetical protein